MPRFTSSRSPESVRGLDHGGYVGIFPRAFVDPRSPGRRMKAAPGLFVLLIATALLVAPCWSSTLPASDYPLTIVLGTAFAAVGVFAALPDSWPRLRTLSFAAFMATFGLVCAALTLSPLHPAADGHGPSAGLPDSAPRAPYPGGREWLRDSSRSFAWVPPRSGFGRRARAARFRTRPRGSAGVAAAGGSATHLRLSADYSTRLPRAGPALPERSSAEAP